MFFRSKSKVAKEATASGAAAPPTVEEKPHIEEQRTWFSLTDAPLPAKVSKAPTAPTSSPPAVTSSAVDSGGGLQDAVMRASASSAEDHQKRLDRSRQFALALGQITTVAMHSMQHQSLKLSEFRARIVPALINGQFALASRRDERLGVQTPVTALLWASVSDAVDERLSGGHVDEVTLQRSEWRGGPHVWVVDVFGDQAMLPGLLRQLGESQWNGRPVKMFAREADGRRVVRVVHPA